MFSISPHGIRPLFVVILNYHTSLVSLHNIFFMKKMYGMSRQAAYWLQVVSLGLIMGLGLQFAQAWTAPPAAPLAGNVAGPLTTSSVTQTKPGALVLSGGGAYGFGGLTIGNVSLNSNNDTWLRLGDSSYNVYGDKGLAADYLFAGKGFYSNNWGQFTSGTSGYAAGFYGTGGTINSAPKSPDGSIIANDIYLRSINKWASEVVGGGTITPNYAVLPGGLIIQWGRVTVPGTYGVPYDGLGYKDVALPIPYPRAHLTAQGSIVDVAGFANDTNRDATAYPQSLTHVRVVNGDPGNPVTINWLSIGW